MGTSLSLPLSDILLSRCQGHWGELRWVYVTLFLTSGNPFLVSTRGSKRSANLPPSLARVVGEDMPQKQNVSVSPFSFSFCPQSQFVLRAPSQ